MPRKFKHASSGNNLNDEAEREVEEIENVIDVRLREDNTQEAEGQQTQTLKGCPSRIKHRHLHKNKVTTNS